jgi:hypothetical protein
MLGREQLNAAGEKNQGVNQETCEILKQLVRLESENKVDQMLRPSELALQSNPTSTPLRIAAAYFRSRIC